MFFSIIIPTFNSQNDIANAIKHIIDQDFHDFELLIIDGLSTDRTIRIIEGFNDPRIKIFSEKDAGIYDAMNKGIGISKGEWLYFLGSDDDLFDDTVLTDVNAVIRKEPEIAVLYGDALFKHTKTKHYGPTSLKRILYENNICHQAIFYHRSVFEKLGNYNRKYNLYADWDVNIRCFMHPDIHIKYVDRIIANYNEMDGLSAREINTDKHFMDILPAYQLREQTKIYNDEIERLKNKIVHSVDYKIKKLLLLPYNVVKNTWPLKAKRS